MKTHLAIELSAQVVTNPGIRSEVDRLLEENKLPFRDLGLVEHVLVAYHDQSKTLVGCGALEWYGTHALLRSLAVAATFRGRHYGHQIVADLMQRAHARNAEAVYLLTETARDFFLRLGFAHTPRQDVPQALQQASQFATVCPVSAACMVHRLR